MKKNNLEDFINIDKNLLSVIKTKSGLTLTSDNDEDKELIEDITQKTIRSIKKRRIKDVETNIELKSTRKSKNSIKKHIDLYIKYLKLTNKNDKTIKNYIPKFDFLIDYFNYKKIYTLKDITKKDCKDLQLYLLNLPSNINKYKELEEKNIFLLIDKSDKILDKYEKLEKRTVDNYITRYKTLFNYFIDNDYIYNNHFLTIKNLKPKSNNSINTFLNNEDMREQFEIEEIELLLNKIENKEIKSLIVLGVITGGRINELLNLKVENIIKSNYTYLIDIKQSKTNNGIRKIPISGDFKFLIENLIKNKKDTDFLLFNEKIENRNDKIQKRVMYQIRKYIKNKNKVFHSLRKNFTQLLYQTEIEELYIKILLGHSLKDNLSFNTYNLSKIDNKTLINEINKVDFRKVFINTEYFKKEKIEIPKSQINTEDLNKNIF